MRRMIIVVASLALLTSANAVFAQGGGGGGGGGAGGGGAGGAGGGGAGDASPEGISPNGTLPSTIRDIGLSMPVIGNSGIVVSVRCIFLLWKQ